MNGGLLHDTATIDTLAWVSGAWLLSTDLLPITGALHEPHTTGIYVLADPANRILHLGQANRNDGMAGRIRAHMSHATRGHAARVALIRLDEGIPRKALDAIEGAAAWTLGLHLWLPGDRWPNRDEWAQLSARRAA